MRGGVSAAGDVERRRDQRCIYQGHTAPPRSLLQTQREMNGAVRGRLGALHISLRQSKRRQRGLQGPGRRPMECAGFVTPTRPRLLKGKLP